MVSFVIVLVIAFVLAGLYFATRGQNTCAPAGACEKLAPAVKVAAPAPAKKVVVKSAPKTVKKTTTRKSK